jgi:antitoxin component YwqK of YwqJK toxin-antitoxin module
MAFWDWLRPKKPPAPTQPSKTDAPPPGGSMRNGVKHGRWIEREEREDTAWNAETRTFDKLGTGWRELEYVDGIKQGPFVWRYSNGVAQREGTYVNDAIAGKLVIRRRTGEIAGEGTFEANELHGHWIERHIDGTVEYESNYVAGKRQGPWTQYHENGKLANQGVHVSGKREGEWRVWNVDGVLIEHGTYVAGKRDGTWQLRRVDGSPCAEGAYAAGAMTGLWRSISPSGVAGVPRACTDEDDLRRWGELETGVDLIATFAATKEWIERAKAAFSELAQPWQVTAEKDKLGQTHLSAPIDAGWQLRAAVGVPMHEVIRDEVWERIMSMLDELPDAQRADAVAHVEASGLRYPSFAPADWLTKILEGDTDDPRTRIVSRFEPGREFSITCSKRFQRRVPHLQELSLRECSFPDGFGALFDRGYPELERLLVVRNDLDDETAIAELYELLARASWVGKLDQLAIVDNNGGATDEQLAALLANPHLGALHHLTIDASMLGPATARALRDGVAGRCLESLGVRYSKLDVDAIAAIAACPALVELELRECELPDMTSRQAMTIVSPKLAVVNLAGTLGVERWGHGDARSGYAVARRLAVMPALASVEELVLSNNNLDGLAARAIARSPYLAKLSRLEWSGNQTRADELEVLRTVLRDGVLVTDRQPSGNVVVLSL